MIDRKYWMEIKDGDPDALSLYRRHYSRRKYKDGRVVKLFVGPGEKTVLMTPCCGALFVWRKFISMDNQEGINCSVFRNETNILSSLMIIEAEKYALERWGPVRAYTYVNPKKITSSNPGYCFKRAGWRIAGETKRGLVVLEKPGGNLGDFSPAHQNRKPSQTGEILEAASGFEPEDIKSSS